MRKLIASICALIMLVCVPVIAQDYTVELSTYPVAAYSALASYPNISGGAKIDQIVISNNGAVSQVVSIYDTASSTTTAALAFEVYIGTYSEVEIDYPKHNPLTLSNLGANKSDATGGCQLNIQYR